MLANQWGGLAKQMPSQFTVKRDLSVIYKVTLPVVKKILAVRSFTVIDAVNSSYEIWHIQK